MSPVSRGRKIKKRKQQSKQPGRRPNATRAEDAASSLWRPPSEVTVLAGTLGSPRERPAWFDESIDTVLDATAVLMPAQGPRELEEAAAQLLGAEQRRRVQARESGLLWFEWWFEDLAEAAMIRAREAIGGAERYAWEPHWRLLHAMTGLGSPALAHAAQARLGQVAKALPQDLARSQPAWLPLLSKITATGRLWQMHDVYGGRVAVIAGFVYPGGAEPSVFLFDVDACGFITLVGAGTYDDVEHAAAAWRTSVGQAADGARPMPVDAPETLHALLHWDCGEETLIGDEPRPVMDNWFRARRRVHDIADVLQERGTPLPLGKDLYRDLDADRWGESFTTWYAQRHGATPDPEAVAALAYEWLEGRLPGTERAVAPARIRHFRYLMDVDWVPDDPVTIGVKALLPEWVRWNGEQDGLPAHLLDHAVSTATDTTLSAAHLSTDGVDRVR